jgi:hypothetical protein
VGALGRNVLSDPVIVKLGHIDPGDGSVDEPVRSTETSLPLLIVNLTPDKSDLYVHEDIMALSVTENPSHLVEIDVISGSVPLKAMYPMGIGLPTE